MFWKKQRKITALENRIYELEEKICPCSSHDWRQIGTTYMISAPESLYIYQCAKCGKKKTSPFRED